MWFSSLYSAMTTATHYSVVPELWRAIQVAPNMPWVRPSVTLVSTRNLAPMPVHGCTLAAGLSPALTIS